MSMRGYYTLFIFLLIQLGLKYAPTVRATVKCINGIVVQDNDLERCRCPLGWVHKDDNECVDIALLSKCEKEESLNKPCGNYAKCVKETGADVGVDKLKCECVDGYSFIEPTRANNFCIPTACKKKNCGWGKCLHLKNSDAICSCHANFERTVSTSKLTACDKEVALPACKLTCPTDAQCVFDPAHGFYFCKPKAGGNPITNSNAYMSFLSPLYTFLIIVVYMIFLKQA